MLWCSSRGKLGTFISSINTLPLALFLKYFHLFFPPVFHCYWSIVTLHCCVTSAVQKSESVKCMNIHPLPWISFPFSHHWALSRFPVLYSRVSWFIYFIHSIFVYMCIYVNPNFLISCFYLKLISYIWEN